MESVRLPYELLTEIFKIYVFLPDIIPETLLQVCRSWNAVASHEPALWTKFVISEAMIRTKNLDRLAGDATLTRDWVGIFKRRLARAGPRLPLQIFILALHDLLLSVIDVISGGGPDYVHLPRWETLNIEGCDLIRPDTSWAGVWPGIATLISQPTPSLKRLTLRQNKIDFHAFPNAPNLEELNILYNRTPRIGRYNSFPNLKKVHITYPSKYPLSEAHLAGFSLRTIETLIIGGEVAIGTNARGTYPSLSMLEFTECVPCGIEYMTAPGLRHLILRNASLSYPSSNGEYQHGNPQSENREVLEMLAGTFPTVEILEIHENLQNLVLEMLSGEGMFFTGLKELWTISGRSGMDRFGVLMAGNPAQLVAHFH